ncbi:3840_t:CDS:2, partial [Funneliformis caledonium]
YNSEFMIGVVNNQLDLTILIKQRRNHEAYTNQKMEKRIRGIRYQENQVDYNFTNSMVSYLTSNSTARPGIPRYNHWITQPRLETLIQGINVPRLPEISIANVSEFHPINSGGF